MSVSKFCRNFVTYPQMGAKENSCHTTGEKQHRNNETKLQKSRDLQTNRECVNTEEQEHLDVPLVIVFFPESRKKQSDCRLRENATQKKTQHRLSTGLHKDDFADDRGKGFSLIRHSKVHKEEKCREGVICNICNKEFRHRNILKEHIRTHTGEKPFRCSVCYKHFSLEIHLQHHMIIHQGTRNILLGDALDPEESKINVSAWLATSPGETEEKIIQDCIFSSNNCTALVEQLPDNTGLVEGNIHPFQLEESQIQMKPSSPMAPNGSATTDHDTPLSCMNSRLERWSENVCNNVVSENKEVILGEQRTSNTTKSKSNKTEGKGYPTKSVNRKRISLASGIIYEDEVSFPDGSRSSTTAQMLLSSNNSETAEAVLAASSSRGNKSHGTSFSGFDYVGSKMVPLKLLPGSTLVSNRGVLRIKNKEKPFACAYCAKVYKGKKAVFDHIKLQHEEKRYSCEFCGKRYGQQCVLNLHLRVHTQEKPFTCEQCGKCFSRQSDLRRHKSTHTKARPFVCKICNKSYKRKGDLVTHTIIHDRDECRGSICNICKKKLRSPSELRLHMRVHTGDKPFKCSLCDKQFSAKVQLQSHLKTHSGEPRQRKTCSVCGKTVSAAGIYWHMMTHTGEKPFECNICGKRFPRKSNLEGHMRSHTGEKPFACGGCDKRFALYSNMMTHKAKCKKTSDNVT